jgi:hypothetical protein
VGAGLWVPTLLNVEKNVDMSFLAPAPLFAIFASALAAFLFLPAACTVLPGPGSRWHRVAFGPRDSLIEAIRSLRLHGFTVAEPETLFESGAAHGRSRGVEVQVQTRPGGWPPGYRLKIQALRIAEGPVPTAPGFAPRERFRRNGWTVTYEGTTDAGFQVDPDRLLGFVREMAGEL